MELIRKIIEACQAMENLENQPLIQLFGFLGAIALGIGFIEWLKKR